MPWGLVILLGLGLIIGWVLLVAYTAWLLTHPPRRTYAWAVARGVAGDPSEVTPIGSASRGLKYRQWKVSSRGRELPVWDVEGQDSHGPVVVITHGWGDSRTVMLSRLAGLVGMAKRVVLWDMAAHGDAPGGVAGFTLGDREHEDLLAMVDAMKLEQIDRLVLYGASLGAGVSIVSAEKLKKSQTQVDLLICEAPYRVPRVPAGNVLRLRGLPYRSNLGPAMAMVGGVLGHGFSWARHGEADGFDRVIAAKLLGPATRLLCICGSDDRVCPIEDARAIVEAAKVGGAQASVVEIAGGGHTNLWTDPKLAEACVNACREAMRA